MTRLAGARGAMHDCLVDLCRMHLGRGRAQLSKQLRWPQRKPRSSHCRRKTLPSQRLRKLPLRRLRKPQLQGSSCRPLPSGILKLTQLEWAKPQPIGESLAGHNAGAGDLHSDVLKPSKPGCLDPRSRRSMF